MLIMTADAEDAAGCAYTNCMRRQLANMHAPMRNANHIGELCILEMEVLLQHLDMSTCHKPSMQLCPAADD